MITAPTIAAALLYSLLFWCKYSLYRPHCAVNMRHITISHSIIYLMENIPGPSKTARRNIAAESTQLELRVLRLRETSVKRRGTRTGHIGVLGLPRPQS